MGYGKFATLFEASWYDPNAYKGVWGRLAHRLVSPLGLFYGVGLHVHQHWNRLRSIRVPAYVVSVGNLCVGGSGKTPLVLWLARCFQSHGHGVAILSRGYGGCASHVQRVPQEGKSRERARLYGDEPTLLASRLPNVPVYVSRNRVHAALEALRNPHIRVLILDDGFQHLALQRDLDIVLMDAGNPLGNGLLLPLGPLREPIQHLGRADVLVWNHGHGSPHLPSLSIRVFQGKRVHHVTGTIAGFRSFSARDVLPCQSLRDRSVTAFCAIARPHRFKVSLEGMGIRVSHFIPYPDHHFFSLHDCFRILREARSHDADLLVTTEKDYVRLPSWMQRAVLYADYRLEFLGDERSFEQILMDHFHGAEKVPVP